MATSMSKKQEKMARAEAALRKNRESLMVVPGVTGVGIGGTADAPVVLVMVRQLTPELKKKLSRQVGDFPVWMEVSGEITAF
jgi:hypothetical protein